MSSGSMAMAGRMLSPAISAAERIWDEIGVSASQLAAREPLLRRMLDDIVLRHDSPARMLAAMLARRLSCANLEESALHALFEAVAADDGLLPSEAETDIAAVVQRDPACPGPLHVLLNLKGFHALLAYRMAHRLWHRNRLEAAYALSNRASAVFGVDIHPAARIGIGIMLDHGTGIVIGETAVVDDNVSIMQGVTLGGTGKERGDRHPKIRSGVMIGAGSKILGNIVVGSMSRIAAGSVVLKDVPPCSTVAGVPARVVRRDEAGGSPAFEMNQEI